MTESAGPVRPIASENVPWQVWSDPPNFAQRSRHLSRALLGDRYQIGVAIEELEPGKRSAPFHYHFFEEEHVFVLAGVVSLRLGAATYDMRAGDYVCFPAGQRAGHCLVNNSSETCRYLIVGERNPREVCVYPDSNKVMVRALARNAIFDMAATRNYWHGEETGLPMSLPAALIAAEEEPHPKRPISSDAVEWEETQIGTNFGGRARHLTYAATGADYRIGMLIESPAPGKRLCPRHYHMLEEEHALILEGEVTLLLGAERHLMKAGDYVCFPAGRKIGHSFLNSGAGECRYLMIGARDPNEVCVYPDSNKMVVGALRSRQDIFDMSNPRDYWDGEAIGD
ncbi:cupin domain-containing protein [Dongia sp.]|uniref:cupin domain-containing protein n=1 Tax=Dongia sp. TaxID=1977262 RepID=UPI0035B3227B